MKRPTLILCIDRDNDLFEKARLGGPVIGRERNIEAATALALADPEDPDSNAIFYAIKLHDQMKKEGRSVEAVTLTGHRDLGHAADMEISRQLERVMAELHPESCILVSDGASDEEILPVIKSRLPIDSTKIIFIKQAKELEKTYFVILEKLKDPHYARLVLGLPALFILLFSLASFLGMGWQPVGIVLGLYLILKGFGADAYIFNIVQDFRFSIEKTSWVGYIAGFVLLLATVLLAYQTYQDPLSRTLSPDKLISYIIRSNIVVPLVAFLLIISAKSIDALIEKRKFVVTRYALYSIAAILTVVVLRVGSDWVLNRFQPYVSFGDFLLTLVVSIFLGYVSIRVIKDIRANLLLNLKLPGKEVLNEHGSYLGKVVGIDSKEGVLIIQTMADKRYELPLGALLSIDDRLVVKGEG